MKKSSRKGRKPIKKEVIAENMVLNMTLDELCVSDVAPEAVSNLRKKLQECISLNTRDTDLISAALAMELLELETSVILAEMQSRSRRRSR